MARDKFRVQRIAPTGATKDDGRPFFLSGAELKARQVLFAAARTGDRTAQATARRRWPTLRIWTQQEIQRYTQAQGGH